MCMYIICIRKKKVLHDVDHFVEHLQRFFNIKLVYHEGSSKLFSLTFENVCVFMND